MKYIASYAFDSKNIYNLKFGKSVEKIGNYSFYECTNLKTIEFDLNSNLKSIGTSAFEKCTNLIYIHIPKTIESIGSNCLDITQSVMYFLNLLI